MRTQLTAANATAASAANVVVRNWANMTHLSPGWSRYHNWKLLLTDVPQRVAQDVGKKLQMLQKMLFSGNQTV